VTSLPIPGATVVGAADPDRRVPGELHGDRAARDQGNRQVYGSKELVATASVTVQGGLAPAGLTPASIGITVNPAMPPTMRETRIMLSKP
jgi:hypothetical protein